MLRTASGPGSRNRFVVAVEPQEVVVGEAETADGRI